MHSELKRVIHLLPPTMGLVMGLTTVLLVIQAVLRSFDARALGVLVPFLVLLTAVVAQLAPGIRGVDAVSSEGDIHDVRRCLGALALLHHQGLATSAVGLALQLSLVG